MSDINTNDGVILEALNNKADLDLATVHPFQTFKGQSALWALPGDEYTDLTLLKNNSTYLSPGNG